MNETSYFVLQAMIYRPPGSICTVRLCQYVFNKLNGFFFTVFGFDTPDPH